MYNWDRVTSCWESKLIATMLFVVMTAIAASVLHNIFAASPAMLVLIAVGLSTKFVADILRKDNENDVMLYIWNCMFYYWSVLMMCSLGRWYE